MAEKVKKERQHNIIPKSVMLYARVTKAEAAQLQVLADRHNMTMSKFMRSLLYDRLDEEGLNPFNK